MTRPTKSKYGQSGDPTVRVLDRKPLKIVFINGPPRSGKDTLAKLLMQSIGRGRIYKMTTPMDMAIKQAFNIPNDEWMRLREQGKDMAYDKFAGKTLRQVLIEFSERFMKPNFGQNIFGTLAVEHLRDSQGMSQAVFISDSGFVDESIPIAEHFGYKNCVQLVLERDGCSFENDSRSVWSHDKIVQIRINNNSTPRFLQSMATYELTKLFDLATIPGYELKWE